MRIIISSCLAICSLIVGCASAGVSPEAVTLEGRISAFGAGRQVAASLDTIASGATVSLIEPDTGNTLGTALTYASGRFRLSFSNSFRPGKGPYVLEAVKGGQAGTSLARVRTLVSRQSDTWQSLSGSGVVISGASTAIAILSSLKGLDSDQNLALLNSISPEVPSSLGGFSCPDTFRPASGISALEFQQAYDLVQQTLALDADPVASIFARDPNAFTSGIASASSGTGANGGLAMAQDGWAVTSLVPSTASAAIASTLTVRGVGLPRATDSLQVTLNGAACQAIAASQGGTQLTVQIPAGLGAGNTYPLVITYGPWIDRSKTVTIQ